MKRYKLFLVPFIAFTLLVSCSESSDSGESSTETEIEAGKTATVTGDKINIRSKATIDSDVLGLLRQGQEIEILESGIGGRSKEAILKEDTDFYYENTNVFAMTVNKGRAVKIVEYLEDSDQFEVFLYMKNDKMLAKVDPDYLEFLTKDKWAKFRTNEGTVGFCLEKYLSIPDAGDKKESLVTIYKSDDLGYIEYMKKVDNPDGSYDWYYYTEKNPKERKLGITEKDGYEAVYFFNKPDVVYEIGGSICGFTVVDPKGVAQWYSQQSPPCE